MSSISFQEETIREVWPELNSLTKEHYKEVSLLADQIELDVDIDYYLQLEELGMVRVFTVRENNSLVGYASFFIVGSPRYKGKKVAQNDGIFIQERIRQGFLGIKFIKAITKELSTSCDIILWHVKDKYDFSPILKRMNFIKQDTVWSLLVEK
jgi:hypothetical protein